MINSKREILVATRKENPAKGTFDLPGGFVDLDETAEEAVVREVYEETGLKTDKLTYLFSLPNTYNFSDFEVQTTDMFFLCSIEDDANFIAADDVSDLHFIALSELNPSNFGLQSIRKGIEKLQTLNL